MPNQRSALKSALKGTTALAGLFGLTVFGTTPALATCDNLAPTTGQTVTCSTAGGAETNSITTGNNVTDVTVNFDANAAQNVAGDGTAFGNDNLNHVVTMSDGASITTTGNNADAFSFGTNAVNNAVFFNGSSTISTDGQSAVGVVLQTSANNNSIVLNDSAAITTTNTGGAGVGFWSYASDNTVTLNTSASIATTGRSANNIHFELTPSGNVVTLNGGAAISTVGYSADNIFFDRNASNNAVALNDNSSMSATGDFAESIAFDFFASHNSVTLNGSANISTTGGQSYGAIRFKTQSTNNTVTLNETASISTGGQRSPAIRFELNNDGNSVTLNGSASISTTGYLSEGVQFRNITNGGSVILNESASITTTGNRSPGIGFDHTTNGNNVTLNGTASIVTNGTGDSHGISFSYGGVGNTVTLGLGTSVVTNGSAASAIKDGDGSLSIISAGLLSSESGRAVDLGAGDDSLTLLDGAQVVGWADGGGGTDTLVLEGSAGFLDFNHVNFENLTVQAVIGGVWNVTTDVVLTGVANVDQGLLSVNATLTAPTVAVAAGAILGGSGTVNSAVTLGGILAPGNSVGTLNVNGLVTFAAGAAHDVEVDRTGMDLLAVSGAPGTVTIDPATTVNVIHLDRAEGHAGNIVTATGGITGSFGTLNTAASPANSIAATLVQSATSIRLVTAAPSVFSSQVWAGSEEGFAFQDMLSDEAGASRTLTDRRGWTSATYRNAERSRSRTIQPFDQNLQGTALGTDLYREGPVRIGAAVGYTGSEVELGSATGEGDFDSIHGGLYGSYHRGGYFLDGTVTGGYQDGDGERVVIVDGATLKAKADSGGYLVGTSVRTGWTLPLGGGWSARPSVGFSYMHRHQDRYSERGAGDAGVSLDSEKSDTARMNWQVQVARASTISFGGKSIALHPSARLGLMREWALDDRNIQGRFQADGSAFSLHMDARDETLATFGAGIDATFDGWTLFAAYDGAASQITDRNTVTAGIRKAW